MALQTKDTESPGFSVNEQAFLKGFMGSTKWMEVMDRLAKVKSCKVCEGIIPLTYKEWFEPTPPDIETQKYIRKYLAALYPEVFE